jgi:hypothetical protein
VVVRVRTSVTRDVATDVTVRVTGLGVKVAVVVRMDSAVVVIKVGVVTVRYEVTGTPATVVVTGIVAVTRSVDVTNVE